MTGITDIMMTGRRVYGWATSSGLKKFLQKLPLPRLLVNALCELFTSTGVDDDIVGRMPMPRIEYFQEDSSQETSLVSEAYPATILHSEETPQSLHAVRESEKLNWGLLLPICFRDSGKDEEANPEEHWRRLEKFASSLRATTSKKDRSHLNLYIGIDQFDVLFDSESGFQRLRKIFALTSLGITSDGSETTDHDPTIGGRVHIQTLRSSFRGKLCKIWEELAGIALRDGVDFFVLLGDDIVLKTTGWKKEIEGVFSDVASQKGLPFGIACVAFRDMAFPVFPTFPVIHKIHFQIFGRLFPRAFDGANQHGDPYLFEIYRRFGASVFAPAATLENTVGGSANNTRYSKRGPDWTGEVLSDAVKTLEHWLITKGRYHNHNSGDISIASNGRQIRKMHCINVVVPTYRCDMNILQGIVALKADSRYVSVHILIVVDNPSADNLNAVRALADWTPNHLVRIYVNPTNLGAPTARNVGLAQSFGDWTVLLDDDVRPSPNLLDAYVGAVMRYPNARILVGTTQLPKPVTKVEKAIVASQMCFFYSVAERLANPPWGVTANLCVASRLPEGSKIWFDDRYPKSGGGEDVDFCIRTKNLVTGARRDTVIQAVPEAIVEHPFWKDINRQVAGWAKGDSKCLSALPLSTFYHLPNWVEFLMLYIIYLAAYLCYHRRRGKSVSSFGSCPLQANQADPSSSPAAGRMISSHQVGWLSRLSSTYPSELWRTTAWYCLLGCLAIVAVEVILCAITVWPNTRGLAGSPLERCEITLRALIPGLWQDLNRLKWKLSAGRFNLLFCQFDWMDGQGGHVSTIRGALLVKNIAFLLALLMVKTKSLFLRSVCFTLLLWIALFWRHAHMFSEEAMRRDYIRNGLPPLRFLEEDTTVKESVPYPYVQPALRTLGWLGRSLPGFCSGDVSGGWTSTATAATTEQQSVVSSNAPTTMAGTRNMDARNGSCSHLQPFVVLAYQRTGSNYLCGRLHMHKEILMHSEVFNEARIYLYADKADKHHPHGQQSGVRLLSETSSNISHHSLTPPPSPPSSVSPSSEEDSHDDPESFSRAVHGTTPTAPPATCTSRTPGMKMSDFSDKNFSNAVGVQKMTDKPRSCGGSVDLWSWNIWRRNRDPQGFLQAILRDFPEDLIPCWKGPSNRMKAVGFKLFPEHWRGDTERLFQRLCVNGNVKKIILKRDNLLAMYVSKLRADRTGSYLGASLDGVKVRVNPQAFENFITNYQAVYDYYERLLVGQDSDHVFRVTYEELTAPGEIGDATWRRLFGFLGVNSHGDLPKELGITQKQSDPDRLTEDIINYDSLAYAFRHHPKVAHFFS